MGKDRESDAPWFRPRRYGYGVTPNSDKGVVASVAVLIALGLCIGLPAMLMGPSFAALAVSAVSFVVVLGLFIAIAWKHTDRSP
jgi:hypothetical protein